MPEALQEFVKKYGVKGLGLVMREFINRAPAFKGDAELASELGKMVGELEGIFEEVK